MQDLDVARREQDDYLQDWPPDGLKVYVLGLLVKLLFLVLWEAITAQIYANGNRGR